MSDLPTPRSYAGTHFRVAASCRNCEHAVRLDLAALAAGPNADMPLTELPLRCEQCGVRGHDIRVSYDGPVWERGTRPR
jgi:hypothetical protein